MPGRKAEGQLTIPLSGTIIPASLRRIELVVEVAGRRFAQTFPAAPNQKTIFAAWDGKDAYGRPVQGGQRTVVRIGYVYDGVYQQTTRFGYNGNGRITGDRMRQEVTLWQVSETTMTVNAWNQVNVALGGWSVNVHHVYDPIEKTLFLGNGQRRSSAANLSSVITTVAGNGQQGCTPTTAQCGDGGLATQAPLFPADIAVASDGSFYLYVADFATQRVRRVDVNGIIETVAGNGNYCADYQVCGGDGGPATQAYFLPTGIASAPDGSLYIGDGAHYRVRRVRPDGIIETIAGNGSLHCSGSTPLEQQRCGDGEPATQVSIYPFAIAVAPDDSLYIADAASSRIRRVNTDGIIDTMVGSGCTDPADPCGDGGPASQAKLSNIGSIAFGPDGSLYIADLSRVRRIRPDGIIETVAGNGNYCSEQADPCGDGGPAIQASITPRDVAVASDGGLYIAEAHALRVRRVSQDGVITTVAGGNYQVCQFDPTCGDGGLPTQAGFLHPLRLASVPSSNSSFFAQSGGKIRFVTTPLPGFFDTQLWITSEDGTELYQFDAFGRHLQTFNTLTGAVLYQFGYVDGRLSTIIDGDNNVTTIERDGNGNPTAARGPFGQRTILSLDANGYLASITNPAGETVRFTYTSEGLMTNMQDARNNEYHFTYNSLGWLTRDDDPAGGFQSLERNELLGGQGFSDGTTGFSYEVARTTALGRTTRYRVGYPGAGPLAAAQVKEAWTNIFPDGTQNQVTFGLNGTQTVTLSDGATMALLQGPDPRFGIQASFPKSSIITTPGGLIATSNTTQTATLTDPSNPFSLSTLIDTTTINGRTFTNSFNAASRTFTNTSPQGRQSMTSIDALGRVTQRQIPELLPIDLVYDTHGRLATITQGSGADKRTETFTYDNNGYLDTITDPLNWIFGFDYDAAGRVMTQTFPNGVLMDYTYDANGNLASLTDQTPPGRPAHVLDYTPVDLGSAYTPPSVAGGGANQTLYSYNLDRQLTRITRPDSKTVQLDYDSAGRLAAQTVERGQSTYTYNPTTGNLSSLTAPDSGVVSYTYDGSLVTGTSWTGMVTGEVTYTYDNNFRLISTQINGANAIAFQYDNDNLLTGAGALTLNRSPQNGLLTGATLGGVSDSLSYNGFGEPTSYNAAYNGTNVYTVTYTRDKLGRISEKSETVGGATTTFQYFYGPGRRLYQVNQNGVTTAVYTYSANTNRLTGPGVSTPATYDVQDRLLQYGNTTYTYTANGELLTRTNGGQTTLYNYDELGNLMSVTLPGGTQIDYLVDGANRRIGKKVNGALVQGFLYRDQLRPIAELDGNNEVVAHFIYGSRFNAPDYMVKGGNTYRIIADHLGSPRLVIDVATGSIVQRMDYDEFGIVQLDTNPGFQPFGFAGGLYDQHTRFVRFGARDYDAETGRWTAKDPLLIRSGDPKLYVYGDPNLYAYVGSDPVNFVDPFGRDIWIEGPSEGEFPFHQSINVGNPNGAYTSTSFGTNSDMAPYGDTYFDEEKGGPITHYIKTTEREDAAAKIELEMEAEGSEFSDLIYGPVTCRTYSQTKFKQFKERFKKQESLPPQR